MAKTLSRLQKDAAAKEKAASAAERASQKATSDADAIAAAIAAASTRAEELAGDVKRLSGERDRRAADVATLEAQVAEVEAQLARIDAGEDADADVDADGAGAGAGAGAGKSSKSKSKDKKDKKKSKGKAMEEDDDDDEDGAGAGAGAAAGRRAAAGTQGTASLTPAKRAEYHALKARERAATADLRARIDRLMRERGEAEAVVAKHRGAITSMEAQKVELTRTAEANATRKAELEAGLKAHGAKRREKEGELEALKKSLAADEERMKELARELFAVKEALGTATDRARRSEAEKREAAAVEDLKRLFPGVRGRLVDLVNPTSKAVKLAVTVALGKHLDAVVVNAQATAFECIRHLREAEVRPITFIPLDAIVPSEPDDELLAQVAAAARSGGGSGAGAGAGGGAGGAGGGASSYRFVRDVLQFDPDLERAVAYAAGSTVIADSLADAKRLRFGAGVRVKVVTLDGSVIAKNGNMTGGVAKGEDGFGAGGAGSRSAVWDEREQRSAMARRDALLKEEALLQRRLSKGRSAGVGDTGAGAGGAGGGGARLGWAAQIEDVETALANLGNFVDVITRDAKAAAARVTECRAELEAIGKRLAAVLPEYDAAAAAIAAADAAIAGVKGEVDAAAEAVFAPFAASLGLASIKDFESAVLAKEEAQQKARAALAERASKLRSKRDFELARRDDAVRQLGQAQARLAGVEKEVAALRGKEADARAAAASAAEAARSAKGEVEAAAAALKKEEGVRAGSGRELRLASDRKAAAAKAVASLQASLALLQSQRHEMLTRAQMEEVRLPVKTGPASAVKAKAKDKGKGKGKGVPKSAGAGGKGKKKDMDEDDEDIDDESSDSDSDASDDEDEEAGSAGAGAGAGSGGTPARVFSEAFPATGSAGGTSSESPAAAAARKAAADERRSARVDYSLLEEEYREAAESGSPPAEEVTAKLEARVHALTAEMARMSPNLKAGALLAEVDARLKAET